MNPGAPEVSPRLPAVIFFDEQTAGLKIATLPLLDRLMVALHRAGASPITVVSREPLPELPRSTALGIRWQTTQQIPKREQPTLLADSNLLVQTSDVRALMEQPGRLVTLNGAAVSIGVLPPSESDWRAALEILPARIAGGVAASVTDSTSARVAEKKLWASLTSSADGWVDKVFNRPSGRILSKLLVHTPISPNAVSLASIVIGLLAAVFFAMGNPQAIVIGAILFQLSAIVDCVDGDLARILFKESRLGKWLDLAGDQVVHVSVFAGIAIGLMRSGDSEVALWLGISAVLGASLSFAVVVRGMKQPSDKRSVLLQKLIDSATNRDFSVLVLVLACVNALDWFLWMAAIGSHLFWIAALTLQLGSRPTQSDAQ